MSKASEKKSPGASDGTKFSGAKEPLVNYPVSVFLLSTADVGL